MEKRICQNCKTDFVIDAQDQAFYEKMNVPAPTFCPECRYQRRLINRNEWSFYQRKCDATGETIVSIFNEHAPFPVYKQKSWWSDDWDPLTYGRDIDFSRPFFEQFYELSLKVPHLAIVHESSINSEYSNQSGNNKDCYMVVSSNANEKCIYGNWYQAGCYFSCDCYDIEKSELCYECFHCARCYSCTFSQELYDCTSCHFSLDLKGCSDCFGSVGLRNKQYHFFNEPLSKEEYRKRIEKMIWTRSFIQKMRREAYEFSLSFPRKFYHGKKNVDSSGDYLESTKKVLMGFNCKYAENIAYAQDAWWSKDSYDVTEVFAELSYECQRTLSATSIGLRSCWSTNDSYYSDTCFSCSNIFGCMALRQKHYCILNKQYSKEEYHKLRAKLIEHMKKTGEWGEYYPPAISPFGYNESVAQEHFPLTKEKALAKGFLWYDRLARDFRPTMKRNDLPKEVKAVNDSIMKEVIQCRSRETEGDKAKYSLCTTAYAIIPMELEFYRKMNIPLPEKCFPCRRQDRFALRNPRKLWTRLCQCAGSASDSGAYKNALSHFHKANQCTNEFETSYAPERPEIVYCEQCYNQEVA